MLDMRYMLNAIMNYWPSGDKSIHFQHLTWFKASGADRAVKLDTS